MKAVSTVNLARININLLVTLGTLLEERSVTRAAKRLGLSQPAVSNALARLREPFGDPLFVRSGAKMVPTPRAAEMEPLLPEALAILQRAVTPPGAFDPKTATHRFTLAATDYIEMVLLPLIMRRVSAAAPRVTLDVSPIGEASPLGPGRSRRGARRSRPRAPHRALCLAFPGGAARHRRH